MKSITIKEVAKACGVSPATVSQVINNGGRPVNAKTRARVLETLRQMNYYPSAVARGMSSKRMNTLGIVLPQGNQIFATDPYSGPIFDGILNTARNTHQNVMFFTGDAWSDASASLPIYCDGRSDGLLLVSSSIESDIVDSLLRAEVPFVLINTWHESPLASSVDIENVVASQELVRHLLEYGHRRVGIFYPSSVRRSYPAERKEGYFAAMSEAGIVPDERWLVSVTYEEGSLEAGLETLLRLPTEVRPTALFLFTDWLAVRALEFLAQRGIRVPEDLSVVGFDDTRQSATTHPPLTTMRQPLEQIGKRAAEIVLEQIETGRLLGIKELLPTELIRRGSVAPPR